LVLAIIADDLGMRRRQWYITTSLIAVVLAGIGPITTLIADQCSMFTVATRF